MHNYFTLCVRFLAPFPSFCTYRIAAIFMVKKLFKEYSLLKSCSATMPF